MPDGAALIRPTSQLPAAASGSSFSQQLPADDGGVALGLAVVTAARTVKVL